LTWRLLKPIDHPHRGAMFRNYRRVKLFAHPYFKLLEFRIIRPYKDCTGLNKYCSTEVSGGEKAASPQDMTASD